MAQVMELVNWVFANWQNMFVAVESILAAFIVLFLLIPGDQPEKFLQSVLDFVKKFSKK